MTLANKTTKKFRMAGRLSLAILPETSDLGHDRSYIAGGGRSGR